MNGQGKGTASGRPLDLDILHLDKGAHDGPDDGACVMEAVAWLAGEPWSDRPGCASPVIGAFLREWNDALDDGVRQGLKQYISRLVGSRASQEVEERRAWMALDWLIRTYTPAWLRLAGLIGPADALAALPELSVHMDMLSIRPAIDAAAENAARDAAWDAARAAAGAATWAAAKDAARAAAWAAGVAAWAAAENAAGVAAWAAAWAAAENAAGVAAWAAAWAAAAAAGAALQPTVDTLQTDAHRLVDRMLEVAET